MSINLFHYFLAKFAQCSMCSGKRKQIIYNLLRNIFFSPNFVFFLLLVIHELEEVHPMMGKNTILARE